MNTVFVIQHLHVLPQGEEDFKLIGVYSTRAKALAAIERLREAPGFRDFPELVDPANSPTGAQGFYVDEFPLDLDHWSEGFETV
jgi:hypothetical protein